jgi:hypothetical protein
MKVEKKEKRQIKEDKKSENQRVQTMNENMWLESSKSN